MSGKVGRDSYDKVVLGIEYGDCFGTCKSTRAEEAWLGGCDFIEVLRQSLVERTLLRNENVAVDHDPDFGGEGHKGRLFLQIRDIPGNETLGRRADCCVTRELPEHPWELVWDLRVA